MWEYLVREMKKAYVDADEAEGADVDGDPAILANELQQLGLVREVDIVVLIAAADVFKDHGGRESGRWFLSGTRVVCRVRNEMKCTLSTLCK